MYACYSNACSRWEIDKRNSGVIDSRASLHSSSVSIAQRPQCSSYRLLHLCAYVCVYTVIFECVSGAGVWVKIGVSVDFHTVSRYESVLRY